jgi:hypothetical protein
MTTRRTVLFLSIGALVAGCGGGGFRQSRLNPLNWFGRSRNRAEAAPAEAIAAPDPLVEEVLSFVVEPIRGGAILRATGRTPTQGWWNAELVERATEETDVLTLDFRIFPPVEDTDVNTPRSREVTVALYRSDIKLAGIREIVVQGATNARTSRR